MCEMVGKIRYNYKQANHQHITVCLATVRLELAAIYGTKYHKFIYNNSYNKILYLRRLQRYVYVASILKYYKCKNNSVCLLQILNPKEEHSLLLIGAVRVKPGAATSNCIKKTLVSTGIFK